MLAPEPESEPEPRTPAQQPVERPSAADVLENLFGNHAVSDFFFVQVGANVGDTPQDPLYKSVLKYGWHGLLVEPLTHAMEKLRSNYKGCDGLIFEQCAISDEEGDHTLHFPDETDGDFRSLHVDMQTIAKGTASFDADHTNKVCKVQGHSIAMSHEICRCSTMADVLESRQVAPEAVSLLVVDTEGHDHVILNSLDYTVSSTAAALCLHRVLALPCAWFSVNSRVMSACGRALGHRCFGRRQSCLNTGTPMALGHSLCERDRTSTWSTRLFMTPGNRSFGVHLFTSEIPTEGVSWARWQPQPGVIAMPCLRHMNSDLSSVLATCCHRYTTVRLDLMDTLAVLDPSSLAGPFLECSLPCFEKPSTKRQTLQTRFRLQSAVQLDGRASLCFAMSYHSVHDSLASDIVLLHRTRYQSRILSIFRHRCSSLTSGNNRNFDRCRGCRLLTSL